MPEREAAAVLGTSHFRVLIGREELGFSEVSPLSSEADLESGEQFAHVVLRRALRARIVKHVSGPLNAKGCDVAMEELTLAYERLEME